MYQVELTLTLAIQILDEERKLTYIFIFTHLFQASKGYMKACGASKGFMKAFIKPFDAPQESEKIKM